MTIGEALWLGGLSLWPLPLVIQAAALWRHKKYVRPQQQSDTAKMLEAQKLVEDSCCDEEGILTEQHVAQLCAERDATLYLTRMMRRDFGKGRGLVEYLLGLDTTMKSVTAALRGRLLDLPAIDYLLDGAMLLLTPSDSKHAIHTEVQRVIRRVNSSNAIGDAAKKVAFSQWSYQPPSALAYSSFRDIISLCAYHYGEPTTDHVEEGGEAGHETSLGWWAEHYELDPTNKSFLTDLSEHLADPDHDTCVTGCPIHC